MNRAHSVIVRACSRLAVRAGAWIIGLAVVWMAASPRPMWGQWNGTNPVWTNSNVGIGTTSPATTLDTAGTMRSTGALTPASGMGVETAWANSQGYIAAYDRSGSAYKPLNFLGSSLLLNPNGQGNVGIGTTNPQYLLSVKGTVGAEEFIVTNTGWSDYVFQPGYRLRSLSEVSSYIQANHHLPDIPSEAEVKEKGVSVGAMQAKLLAKVEELTLHMIQQEQQNQELRDRIARLEKGAASVTTTAAK